MLLKIATRHKPATDLGYLLRKNPANIHRSNLSFGQTLIFYPKASEAYCEAVLLLDVDPVRLVRGRSGAKAPALLDHYINDRPYAASSLLSVAMNRTLRDAMLARAPDRPQLADTAIPLTLTITALPCRGSEDILQRLFAPLGYEIETREIMLDQRHPEWGISPYRNVQLTGTLRLADALTHLYVLIPVLDNTKHYWIGDDEVQKLIAKGGAWLQNHPERDWITQRYLHRRRYVESALLLLDEKFGPAGLDDSADDADGQAGEAALEKPLGLNAKRDAAVIAALQRLGAGKICDLGCGDGRLLKQLLQDPVFQQVVGMDVSSMALERAARHLQLEQMSPGQKARIALQHGSLLYEDPRLEGFDAITLVEVIEHIDPERLQAFERVVFHKAAPRAVIVTTPNIAFNNTFKNLSAGALRHIDHRFEWSVSEFKTWAEDVGQRQGYQVAFEDIGVAHPDYGPPTQMAVFSKAEA